jgi:hypothetical protein
MIHLFSFLIASAVSLSWNPSPMATGYKLYVGATSGNYTQMFDAGNNLSFSLMNLTPGISYFFAVTCYDSIEESDFSSEAVYVVPMPDLSLSISPSALSLKAFPNGTFFVMHSSDLKSWSPFQTVSSSSDLTSIPITENLPVQFYRAKWISSQRVPLQPYVAMTEEPMSLVKIASVNPKPKSFWRKLRLFFRYRPKVDIQKLMPPNFIKPKGVK